MIFIDLFFCFFFFSKKNEIFFPVESPLPTEDFSRKSPFSTEQINGNHITPMANASKGIKYVVYYVWIFIRFYFL